MTVEMFLVYNENFIDSLYFADFTVDWKNDNILFIGLIRFSHQV